MLGASPATTLTHLCGRTPARTWRGHCEPLERDCVTDRHAARREGRRRLTALLLPGASAPSGAEFAPENDPSFADVRSQLHEYFAGTRTTFDLQLHPTGSAFQLRVWEALREIPYGETASYAEVAAKLGKPGAFRAVGAANGQNPIAIIVPCHRVIGSNGSLVGYGGGLATKRWLLGHEAAHAGLFAV